MLPRLGLGLELRLALTPEFSHGLRFGLVPEGPMDWVEIRIMAWIVGRVKACIVVRAWIVGRVKAWIVVRVTA